MTPASIRNKNPGAQYPGKSSKKFGSATYETLRSKDGVHKIATFPTHEHGAAAQFDLLATAYTGMTIQAAIIKWCGGFYAKSYLGVLEAKAGITASSLLTKDLLADPAFAVPLAKAMAFQEAGQDYPMTDDDWLEAHQMAFGKVAAAPEFSASNDVPSPKPETRQAEAVKAVAKHPVTVAAAGTAATVGTSLLPSPDVATSTVNTIAAYQSLGTKLLGLLTLQNGVLIAVGGAAYVAAVFVLPKLGIGRQA